MFDITQGNWDQMKKDMFTYIHITPRLAHYYDRKARNREIKIIKEFNIL